MSNSNFEFEVEFSLKIEIRLKSIVEFGSKLIKQYKFSQINHKLVQKGVESDQISSSFIKFEIEFSRIWSLRSNLRFKIRKIEIRIKFDQVRPSLLHLLLAATRLTHLDAKCP